MFDTLKGSETKEKCLKTSFKIVEKHISHIVWTEQETYFRAVSRTFLSVLAMFVKIQTVTLCDRTHPEGSLVIHGCHS